MSKATKDMSGLERLVTEKSLALASNSDGDAIVDCLIESEKATRNICARISEPLANEIDGICNMLGISKRRFVELSLIQAVGQSKHIMNDIDVFDGVGVL